MNSMDWLKSVRENAQKSHIPPVPPEGTPCEKGLNTLIPPVTPCSSQHFLGNENISKGQTVEQKEIYWGEEPEPETSGGHRGNQGFYRGNDGLDHRGDRGNQGKSMISESAPLPEKPKQPYLTAGGDLVIPFDSDPKHHWWKGGQSVKATMAELKAARDLEAQRMSVAAQPEECERGQLTGAIPLSAKPGT